MSVVICVCCAVPPGMVCSRRRRSAAAEPSGNGSSGAPCMAGMPQEIWDRGEAVFSVRLVWVILGCGAWARASEPGPAQGLFSRPRHVQVPVYDTGHRQGWQCMRMKSFSSLRAQRGAVRYPGGQTVRSRIYSVFFNFCNKIYDFLPLRSSTSYVKWYQTFHDPVGWTAHTRHLFFGIFFLRHPSFHIFLIQSPTRAVFFFTVKDTIREAVSWESRGGPADFFTQSQRWRCAVL